MSLHDSDLRSGVTRVLINDLACELQVSSRPILDCLEKIGIHQKKTHSSSLSVFEADQTSLLLELSTLCQYAARDSMGVKFSGLRK